MAGLQTRSVLLDMLKLPQFSVFFGPPINKTVNVVSLRAVDDYAPDASSATRSLLPSAYSRLAERSRFGMLGQCLAERGEIALVNDCRASIDEDR